MHRSLRPEAPTPDAPILRGGLFAWAASPQGEISLLAGPEGLRASWLRAHPFEALAAKGAELGSSEAAGHLRRAVAQLGEYFKGERVDFDLTLAPSGTPFQMSVWKALRGIPHGSAISYAELAARCGSPKASRAVGGANGRNPIPIIIPCHRVIAADGALGGFSSGLDNKRALLALEGVAFRG